MSPLLHAGLLTLHITGGSIAVLAGFGAVAAKKGGEWHKLFGTTFLLAMLLMASAATVLALLLTLLTDMVGQKMNVVAGLFAIYFVLSAWATVKRPENTIGRFDYVGVAIALGAAAIAFSFGFVAIARAKGFDGYGPELFFVFGSIALFAAVMDIRMILAGGIAGARRIARHLWRMCLAFFIASGSFFLGQQKVMPIAMRGSTVLLVLALAPLAFLLFWMVRVRFTRWYGNRPAAA